MLYKEESGKWKADKIPEDFNPIYADSLERYFNYLDPLFEQAQKTSEFEFILSLLSIHGLQDAGWDPFETTQDIFEIVHKLNKKIKYQDEQLHIFLLLYGLIIEASFPYELLANLLNVISGERYKYNFPDKKTGRTYTPQTPSEKINSLITIAKKLGLESSLTPLQEIYDRDLRNAIFHSDYCLYNDELRLPRQSRIYSVSAISELINKTLAYYETINNLVKVYKSSYKIPKVISVHPDFSGDPEEKAITIIRKNTGVIGIKDNWTLEQIQSGKIPFNLSRLLPYEQKMLNENPFLTELPPNKVEKINKILRLFPIFIRKHLLKLSNRFL